MHHPGASSGAEIAKERFFLSSKAEAPDCGCFEGTSTSLRVPGDAKMVLEWAIKLKSRVINQERMFDNVFDLIFNPVDHPRVSSGVH